MFVKQRTDQAPKPCRVVRYADKRPLVVAEGERRRRRPRWRELRASGVEVRAAVAAALLKPFRDAREMKTVISVRIAGMLGTFELGDEMRPWKPGSGRTLRRMCEDQITQDLRTLGVVVAGR